MVYMVLEVAILDIKHGMEAEFETAFSAAQIIISAQDGYLSHELQKCIEKTNRYILLVKWQKLTDHTQGFRASKDYLQWKKLLHHFYQPFPDVEHYQLLQSNDSK